MLKKFKWDAIERFFATVFEVGIPYVTVEMLNLPLIWIPAGTVILTAIKLAIAKNTGRSDSASLNPKI
jgi:hypothetical protein